MNSRMIILATIFSFCCIFSNAQFAPQSWLYVATGEDGFGYIDFGQGTYNHIDDILVRDLDIDDAFYGGFGDDIYVGSTNVYAYPLLFAGAATDSIINAYSWKINASDGKLYILSDSIPYLRVYNRQPLTHDFSLDTNKIPFGAIDLYGYNNLIYILYPQSVVVVNVNTQDTLMTIPTPSTWPTVAFNTFICELNGKIYVHTDYATGAPRYSIIEIDPNTLTAVIAFHYEFQGGTSKFIPTWGGDDKIYHMRDQSHYDVSDDTVYVFNGTSDHVVAYDARSTSLFLYGLTVHPGGHYIAYYNSAGTDTIGIPNWFIDAEYYEIWPGIDENEVASGTLNFLPNPAIAHTSIIFPENVFINEVRIFDLKGKMLHVEEPLNLARSHNLEINNFAAGLYIIRCHTDQGVFVGKLAVQRE